MGRGCEWAVPEPARGGRVLGSNWGGQSPGGMGVCLWAIYVRRGGLRISPIFRQTTRAGRPQPKLVGRGIGILPMGLDGDGRDPRTAGRLPVSLVGRGHWQDANATGGARGRRRVRCALRACGGPLTQGQGRRSARVTPGAAKVADERRSGLVEPTARRGRSSLPGE
jgi:hypothetical protein